MSAALALADGLGVPAAGFDEAENVEHGGVLSMAGGVVDCGWGCRVSWKAGEGLSCFDLIGVRVGA